MEEENMNPAGLGSKLYFCRKEDLEKAPAPLPMQEVKLSEPAHLEGHRIDFKSQADGAAEENDRKDKGWTVTLTGTLEVPKERELQQKKMLRRMLFGEGRLPRKEKKRRMNRVLRNRMAVMTIAKMMLDDSCMVQSVIASSMFPEQIQRTTDGSFVIIPKPAQLLAVTLCMKRIPRVAIKTWRKHQKKLQQDLEKLERVLKTNANETPQ